MFVIKLLLKININIFCLLENIFLTVGISKKHTLIYHVSIGPCGSTSLASAIACLKDLKHLNLEHNNIGPEGATVLAAAFQHHRPYNTGPDT